MKHVILLGAIVSVKFLEKLLKTLNEFYKVSEIEYRYEDRDVSSQTKIERILSSSFAKPELYVFWAIVSTKYWSVYF